jgi:hypothetical protein
MSLRQLHTRIEHLEQLGAKAPESVNTEERAARARWEELRLRRWQQNNRPNEVEKPFTEAEEAEFTELLYRFHPLGASIKAWEEAAEEIERSQQLEFQQKAAAAKMSS